jgi:amidohydrolase
MAQIADQIKKIASLKAAELNDIRKHIHRNPELSFEEYNTSAFIKNLLSKSGIPYTENWVKTGIIARIKGARPGRIIALRAELDALPIQELSSHDYVSQIGGKMHACGHDVHMTCLLGAAMIVNQLKDELQGELLLVFQPGEEKLPGGASLMLKEGIFDEVKPEFIMAQHVFPDLEAGKVGICSGQYMASADEIYISIKGKGGHGALPHLCVDTVLIASHVIVALQSLVSRSSDPLIPSVLTIGRINTVGGATNIIPDEVKLEGTFRTMNENWREKAHQLIKKIIDDTCLSFGATAEVDIKVGYPCLHNDEALAKSMKYKMKEYLGEDNVLDLPKRMTSEDFAYFSQVMPSLFYRLGVRNEAKNIIHGVHTPYFDADEKALEVGAGLMAYLVLSHD